MLLVINVSVLLTNIGLKSMVLICPLSSLVIINKSSIFKSSATCFDIALFIIKLLIFLT